MVQYINDALPEDCAAKYGEKGLYWNPNQLSTNQYNLYRKEKFYTNLNRWNLFSENQKQIYDRMSQDNIGRYAYCSGDFPNFFD